MPPGYDPNKQYPLVFAWHGRGGDGALARLYFKIEEASQGAGVCILQACVGVEGRGAAGTGNSDCNRMLAPEGNE